MSIIYNDFSLRPGDDDRKLRYAGNICTPAQAGGGGHIAALRKDLVELGFFLAKERSSAIAPTFDRWLEEAVREFQVMARRPKVAREETNPPEPEKYLQRLRSVDVPAGDRYPSAESTSVDRFASGIVNATTRRLIALWKQNRWRCPWVIAEWVVPTPAKPKKTLKKRPKYLLNMPTLIAGVGTRTLQRHDLTVSGRTPKVKGEVFLHDFSRQYFSDADPTAPDMRFYLGKEMPFGTRRGPVGWPGLKDTQTKLIKITPQLLIGKDISNDESALASTFRVVAALASIEVSYGFQLVNGYDWACLSGGLCHFALVSPDKKDEKKVGKGELGGIMAWFAHHSLDDFNKHVGSFGLRPLLAWSPDGSNLLNRNSGIYETYSCRESNQAALGETIDTRSKADVLQSWQWLARLTMLAFVAPGYAHANWVLTRLRLRYIGQLPISGGFPSDWTLSRVFSSERLMTKLLRIHVLGSGRLGYRDSEADPPVCRSWIAKLLRATLTNNEIAAGPATWDEAVMTRLDTALNKKFKGYASYVRDGKFIKGDFPRLDDWTWREHGVSTKPRSFKLYADDL
jgi:hypothetical protein